MPKQNKLHSQLKSLFEDIDQEAVGLPPAAPPLPGWQWTGDNKGRYVACGPEVSDALGIAAEAFIGKPVAGFAMSADTIPLVESALFGAQYPAEISGTLLTASGKPVAVRFSVLSGPTDERPVWSGVVQPLVSDLLTTRSRPSLSPSEKRASRRATPTTPAFQLPDEDPLTPTGQESLEQFQPLFQAGVGGDVATMAVPFRMPEDYVGLLEIVDDAGTRQWTSDEQSLVMQVADQLSLALENARLFQETQAALTETATLYAITSAASRSLELEDTLQEMLNRVLDAIGMKMGLIAIYDQNAGALRMVVQENLPEQLVATLRQENGLAGTLCELVYQQRSPLGISNLKTATVTTNVSGLLQLGILSYLGVPLGSKGRVLGTLCTMRETPYTDPEGNLSLMEVAGQQIGIAIENASLFHETQTRAEELATLNEMSRELSAKLNLNDVLDAAYAYIDRLIKAPSCYIAIYNPEENQLSFPLFVSEGQRAEVPARELRERGITEHIIYSRRPLLIKEKVIDTLSAMGIQAFQSRDGVPESWLGVPLMIGDQPIGVIAVQDLHTPRHFNENHSDLLVTIAGQVAIAVQNARLYQEEQRRRQIADSLREIARVVGATLDINLVIERMLDQIIRLIPFTGASIQLVEEGQRRTIGWRGVEDMEVDASQWQSIDDDPLISEVVKTRQPLVLSDTQAESRWNVARKGIRSWLAAPMLAGQEVVGVLTLEHTSAGEYSQESGELAMAVAVQAAVAIQNADLFKQTQQRAEETAALNALARALSSRLGMQQVLNEIHRGVSRLLDAKNFYIGLYDAEDNEITFVLNVTESVVDKGISRISADEGITGYVLRTQENTLISEDVAGWMEAHGIRAIGEPAASWMGVPLLSGGQPTGVMALQTYDETFAYDAHDMSLLAAIASQAAIAIQNARLFEQNQSQLKETEALYKASAELSTAQSFEDVLAVLRKHTVAGQGSNLVAAIAFDHPWDDQNPPEWFEVVARWTVIDENLLDQRYPLNRLPVFKLLAHEVQHTGEALVFEDVLGDKRLDDATRTFYHKFLRAESAMIIPMIVGGKLVGCFNITYPQLTPLLDGEVRRLTALVRQAAVAVQNLRSIELAQQRAKEAQLRSEELALINKVVTALVSSEDLRQSLDSVADTLRYEFDLGSVGVSLLDDTRLTMTVVAESVNEGLPSSIGEIVAVHGNTVLEDVLRARKPLVIDDPANDPRMALPEEQPSSTMMDTLRHNRQIGIFPIVAGGETIGSILLTVPDGTSPLVESDVTLLTTLMGQISTAIENSRLHDQTQQALDETAKLYEASAELNAVKTYDAILTVLRKSTLLGHGGASDVTISIFDNPWTAERRPEWMTAIARWPANPYQEAKTFRIPLGNWTTADQFMHPDQPILIENAPSDARLDSAAHALYVNQLGAKSLLFVPLNVGGQWFGHLIGVYQSALVVMEKELRLLGTLAGQAAVAIQNIRLLDESRRRATQLETAAEIARDTSGSLDLNILLRRAVNLMRERYGYYHASIFLLDDSGLNAVVRESTGDAGEEMKRRGHKLAVGSQSVIGYVTQTGSPLIINDVAQNPTHRPNPLLPDTKAELGLPLKIGYRVIGALDVQSTQVGAFNPDDVNVLQTLADQIAVAVDNARSYELAQLANAESRKRVQELSILYNIGQSIASAPLESSEIAGTIARQFIEILDVPKCTIYAVSVQDESLRVIADMMRAMSDGLPGSEIVGTEDVGATVLLSDHPAVERVINSLQPFSIQANDPFADQVELSYMKKRAIETLVILPLAVKGQAVGVVMLESWGRARSFTTEQLNLAMTLGNAAAVALDNARLYEEQRQATEKLREVDKLKSQFLANMSHELRTPLNSIIGFSRVILKGIDGPITDLQQQDLSAINSAGQHLLNLINDILDISKIEAGKMELGLEEHINLNDLLNSAMSYAVGLTKDKPIKLIKDYASELPEVRADPTKLRQVIINFLSNASKFTEEGSITLRAKEQRGPGGRPEIKVSVIDTGVGISPEDQVRLFQPFTQVDGSLTRKVGGTGLGLSISKRLIEMHDGRVELESSIGIGSTFSVVLPLPYVEWVDESAPQGNRVVLSIDDDRQVIGLYGRYLADQGYQVVALDDFEHILEKVKELKPYAITLDIMLPARNGWQILEALKADQETHDIPVIICSIVDNQEKGFSLGAADYLTKPILQEDLINALNRLNSDGSISDVLVIDDDVDDLRLVQKILEDGGRYQVRTADGGPQGLAAIHEKAPHAIILDLMMPELDGFSLLEAIRSDPDFRDIPVIIFTAGDLNEEQKLHLAELSQQMIFKNAFEEQDLLKSIEHALNRFKG
ncbi:MAG: GAF domain-containing protein [Chloroflexota bacterium]